MSSNVLAKISCFLFGSAAGLTAGRFLYQHKQSDKPIIQSVAPVPEVKQEYKLFIDTQTSPPQIIYEYRKGAITTTTTEFGNIRTKVTYH